MADWVTDVVENLSYWGIAMLMILENIFPPIPSEVVLPAAGFTARQGEMAGSLGSLVGVTPWYVVARCVSEERLFRWADRYGKWLTIGRKEADRAIKWFEEWGGITVLLCRMIPGIRTLISVPAGFAKMPFWRFVAYSAIGTLGWSALLAWLGWVLADQYEAVDRYVGWITLAVFVCLFGWWLVRFVRRRRRRARAY